MIDYTEATAIKDISLRLRIIDEAVGEIFFDRSAALPVLFCVQLRNSRDNQ